MAWSIAFSLAVLVVGGCCTTQVKLCSNLVNLGDDGDCSQRTVQARCTKSPVSFQNSMKHAKCPVVSNYTATCGQCVPMAASCVLDCALKGCPRVHVIGVTNVDECSLSNVDILVLRVGQCSKSSNGNNSGREDDEERVNLAVVTLASP